MRDPRLPRGSPDLHAPGQETAENCSFCPPGCLENAPDCNDIPGEEPRGPSDGPTDIFTQGESFVGLSISEATALAEAEGRPWRIGRQDDEVNDVLHIVALTHDLVPGRVTFQIYDGTVRSAIIEQPHTLSPGDATAEDGARARLIAAAVKRLLIVDNSYGGGYVFDDIRIAAVIGSDPGQPLEGLDLELITEALSEFGAVRFVEDADTEIEALFEESPVDVAVVSVESVLLLDDRAEVELRLWCGSHCAVFLTYEAVPYDSGTYEAVPYDSGWNIVGTTGGIAVA